MDADLLTERLVKTLYELRYVVLSFLVVCNVLLNVESKCMVVKYCE